MKSIKFISKVLFLNVILISLLSSSSLYAEKITLNNGRQISGVIKGKTDQFVIIVDKILNMPITYYLDEVASIENDDGSVNVDLIKNEDQQEQVSNADQNVNEESKPVEAAEEGNELTRELMNEQQSSIFDVYVQYHMALKSADVNKVNLYISSEYKDQFQQMVNVSTEQSAVNMMMFLSPNKFKVIDIKVAEDSLTATMDLIGSEMNPFSGETRESIGKILFKKEGNDWKIYQEHWSSESK